MAEPIKELTSRLEALVSRLPDVWSLSACGVTRSQRQIPAIVDRDAYLPDTGRMRVLLLGGLSGTEADVNIALKALDSFADEGDEVTSEIALSAVPCGNPDGFNLGVGPDNGSGGNPTKGYPPEGNYFFDEHDPESRYLWRWLCFQAPDLIIEVRSGDSVSWEANAAASDLGKSLGAGELKPADSLLAAVGEGHPDELAPIPGVRLTTPENDLDDQLALLYQTISGGGSPIGASPARQVLDGRRSRSPLEIARILAGVYGYKLEPVNYTQGVGVSGRVRLALLDADSAGHVDGVAELVEPYVSGEKEVWPGDPGGPNLAGVVWGADMAEATGDSRYNDIVLKAADHYRSLGKGQAPSPSQPTFWPEDMFMTGAMLGRAYKITGDSKYLDILTAFILDGQIQQDDGLFWHSRSAPHYWGRGNGFALMGMTETLTYLPEDHSDRETILGMYRKHLDGLLKVQQPSGMFLQILDYPGTYQEHTSTCMIGYSIARGLQRGWIDSKYEPMLNLAWQGISERVDDSGNVVDGCTGTGVQESFQDYLDREAIFGYDDRTGSLALWFAVEMAKYLRDA